MTMRARVTLGVVIVAVAAAAFWMWRGNAARGTLDGPIVLISIDTLRADRLPAYGSTATRTPNIDRLVADGVLFEQAYAHSPQTLPSHTSILSGELPFEHGVRDNIGFNVKDGQRFLQHALHDRGFATAGFVSSYVLRHQLGINQGFDLYDDEMPPAAADKPLGQVQRPGADTVAAAMRWVDGRPDAKFFLFTHIYEPHRPYTPPERFAAAGPYNGEVEYADQIVGTLLDHLRAKRLYDRATIVLLSDHGEGLGDHGEDEHGMFLYRETVQVPLVIKMPGAARAGSRVAAQVQHIDLVPTLLDLAGASAGTHRGRSLRPALEGSGPLAEASIYSESLMPRYHFGWSELYALTETRYRLIRAPRDELYDITQDPRELHSVASDRQQVHTAMRRALDGIVANATVTAPSAVSDADRERLAALGYVGTQSASVFEGPGDARRDPKDMIETLRRYKQATELAGARRYLEAVAVYRQLLAGDAEMTDVWLQLSEIYGKLGMIAEAVAANQEIIRRNPKDPAALTGAAAGLLRLGKLDEARAHAELAVDVAPATAHQLLARIAVETGDAATARREAALAEQADPAVPVRAMTDGLLLYNAGQYAQAIGPLMQARQAMAEGTVQLPDVNYYLGDSLARLERYAEAERYFADEIRLYPANARAHAGQAMLYRAMGRVDASDRAIAELIRTSPTPEGYGLAADLWTMFGEPAKAAAMRARSRAPTR